MYHHLLFCTKRHETKCGLTCKSGFFWEVSYARSPSAAPLLRSRAPSFAAALEHEPALVPRIFTCRAAFASSARFLCPAVDPPSLSVNVDGNRNGRDERDPQSRLEHPSDGLKEEPTALQRASETSLQPEKHGEESHRMRGHRWYSCAIICCAAFFIAAWSRTPHEQLAASPSFDISTEHGEERSSRGGCCGAFAGSASDEELRADGWATARAEATAATAGPTQYLSD